MSIELPPGLEQEVARYAEAERINPGEAVARLIQNGLSLKGRFPRKGPRPPLRTDNPESTIGLFADMPEFDGIMDEAIARRAEKYGGVR